MFEVRAASRYDQVGGEGPKKVSGVNSTAACLTRIHGAWHSLWDSDPSSDFAIVILMSKNVSGQQSDQEQAKRTEDNGCGKTGSDCAPADSGQLSDANLQADSGHRQGQQKLSRRG